MNRSPATSAGCRPSACWWWRILYAGLLSTDSSFFFLDKPADFRPEYIQFKLPKRSRLLIASGSDNPVLDEGGQGNSVFGKAFLDVLEANNGNHDRPCIVFQGSG